MTNLILNTLYYFNENNDNRFTLDEIKDLIEKYNIIEDNEYNTLGAILLKEIGLVTNEEIAKTLGLRYELDDISNDGKYAFFLHIDEFDDILSEKYETDIKILSPESDIWDNYDGYFDDSLYYLDDLTDDTLNKIIDKLIEKNYTFEDENGDDIEITKDNIKIEKNYLHIFDGSDWIELNAEELKDRFDDLFHVIGNGISDAQRNADESYLYDKVKRNFEDGIGTFKFVTTKRTKYKNVDGEYKNVDVEIEEIRIRLDKFDLNRIKDILMSEGGNYGNDIKDFEETCEDYLNIGNENDFFEIKSPDFDRDYSGSIDRKYLNELVVDRLYEL